MGFKGSEGEKSIFGIKKFKTQNKKYGTLKMCLGLEEWGLAAFSEPIDFSVSWIFFFFFLVKSKKRKELSHKKLDYFLRFVAQ